MLRTMVFSAALAFGLAGAANAGVIHAPLAASDNPIVKVAEGCGPNEWRGEHGHCHPMARHHHCPPHHHLGAHGKRCWPDR
jgi:hypothetical protein